MRCALVLLAVTLLSVAPADAQPPSFMNFESGQTRPLAVSADGARLFAVNTPDARLEIFDLTGGPGPSHVASVPVGLEPIAVAVEDASRVWVVNHLSDSISIVDVAASPPRVVRTLLVGDEPQDIVFAGTSSDRAFITTAHRGQNTADPRGGYATPGLGRADVWVFDTASLGAQLGGTPLTVLSLFGDSPRALARNADGSRVYAAVFRSGNRTTAINEGLVCDGGPSAAACTVESSTPVPGGLPGPVTNFMSVPGPEVGLIVRNDPTSGEWRDELGRDWSSVVRFDLPDLDVFEIDATLSTPAETRAFAGVGTVLYGMAVGPDGTIYVANTDAINDVRFEGPGTYVRSLGVRPAGLPATVRGHLHEARITLIDGTTVTPRHLNPHIPYDAVPMPLDIRHRSVATPNAIVLSADGATAYVAAQGSSAIGVIDTAELAAGTLSTDNDRLISLRDPWPGGPTGLALDEARGRIYALTRFDNTVVTVDLSTREVLDRDRMHSPEDAATVTGRPLLYDALYTSSNGEASCASCHVSGDLDGLAWDLGDPDSMVLSNPNPGGVIGGTAEFNPLKGPMTTQSLRGLADHGPMHWRGDRTGGHSGAEPLDETAAFEEFNVAFAGLVGRDEGALSTAEMRRFAEFGVSIMYPPNPIRQLDNTLRADEARGRDIYFNRSGIDTITTCNGCHALEPSAGFFGGDGRATFEGETQEFKVAHLRNAYTKVGMFGMAVAPFFDAIGSAHQGDQVRGFGFLHDGSTDTAFRFFHATVFSGFASGAAGTTERRDIEAFMMAYDSNLAPIVGQQVTVAGAPDADTQARALLLIDRAQAAFPWRDGTTTTECDLVAHVATGGELRGYLLGSDALFRSNRADEAALDVTGLLTLAESAPVTLTCFPPGSGVRAAQDRDEDGALDGDELDDGTDAAGRAPIAIPSPVVPDPTPMTDGGVDLDAGAALADAGPSGSDAGVGTDGGTSADAGDGGDPPGDCGCRIEARGGSPRGAWPLALGAAALLIRTRRR